MCCSAERKPARGWRAAAPSGPSSFGFIGGLSDRNADNGQAGHNAVVLAVEQFNREGGLTDAWSNSSRATTPRTRDGPRPALALVQAGVEAAIGLHQQYMAAVIVPILGQAGIFEVSPTITSMSFHGQDDNLFRINWTTRDNACDYSAQFWSASASACIALAYDIRNRNFTESWLEGVPPGASSSSLAVLVAEVAYESSPDADFAGVMQQMLQARPDGLFFISGARRGQAGPACAQAGPRIADRRFRGAATEQPIDPVAPWSRAC